jgi:hypothetical protein
MIIVLLFIIVVLAFLTLAGLISPSLIFMRNRTTVLLLMVPLTVVCGIGFGAFYYQSEYFVESKAEITAQGKRSDRIKYCNYFDRRETLQEDNLEEATLKELKKLEAGDEILTVQRIEIRTNDKDIVETAREYNLKVRRKNSGTWITIPVNTTLEILNKTTVNDDDGFVLSATDYSIDGVASLEKLAKRVKKITAREEGEIAAKLDEIRKELFPSYSKDDLERIAYANGWEDYCDRNR